MSRFNAIVVAHRAGTDIVAALAGNDQIDGGDGDDTLLIFAHSYYFTITTLQLVAVNCVSGDDTLSDGACHGEAGRVATRIRKLLAVEAVGCELLSACFATNSLFAGKIQGISLIFWLQIPIPGAAKLLIYVGFPSFSLQ